MISEDLSEYAPPTAYSLIQLILGCSDPAVPDVVGGRRAEEIAASAGRTLFNDSEAVLLLVADTRETISLIEPEVAVLRRLILETAKLLDPPGGYCEWCRKTLDQPPTGHREECPVVPIQTECSRIASESKRKP